MTTTVLRLAAVLAFALSTSACSTIDDLIGDDSPSTATGAPADANGFPPDQAAPAATSDAATPVSPDLASVPDKPTGTTTPDEQKEMADSLATDRARANYSADALRGGTEAAAPPPGAAPAPDTTTVADNAPPAQPAAAAPPPPATAGAPPPSDAAPAQPAPAPAQPAPAPAPTTSDSSAPPAPAPSMAVASAPMAPPPGNQPAVPANAAIPGAQPTQMSDAQLGFKPSTAPALDSSISQFVAPPIVARYQETAANAGVATGPIAPANAMAAATPVVKGRKGRAVGGPEQMGGSVVANLDALNGPAGAAATPSVYANASGLPPAAVVMFPGDGTRLTAAGREQVRAAVAQFQQRGGSGFIKVVGHSSSRTANMPVEKHLVAIFAKSQARANAVAAEIIRQGVPASHVLVEAVGDSQPVYYESMPQGEEGNRRAEIFVQG